MIKAVAARLRYGAAMLANWLKNALTEAGRTQQEAAEFLTQRLGRTYDRVKVNKMASGLRDMRQDEIRALEDWLRKPAPARGEPQEIAEARRMLLELHPDDLSFLRETGRMLIERRRRSETESQS